MTAGVFAGLITDDKIPTVVAGVERAVAASFEADRAPGRVILVHGGPRISRTEMKRRGELCLKVFRVLRGDLKWGVDRIVDELPKYLRAELDGVAWEPEAKRALWASGRP